MDRLSAGQVLVQHFHFFYAKYMMSMTLESIGKLTYSKHISFTIVSMTGKSSQTRFLFFQCFYTVVFYTLGCQLVVSYRTVSYKRGLSVDELMNYQLPRKQKLVEYILLHLYIELMHWKNKHNLL